VVGDPFVIARSGSDEAISKSFLAHARNKLHNPHGFSLPWWEGVRGRGKFTLTLFLSHQGRGDFC